MSVPPWFPWLVPDDPFPGDAQNRSSPSRCPIVVRGAEESTASRFLISPAESAPAGPPPATSASDCPMEVRSSLVRLPGLVASAGGACPGGERPVRGHRLEDQGIGSDDVTGEAADR